MKIVLLQDIKKLGHKYDVKNVADGYARNFLIPKGLVKIATEKILNELETEKKTYQAHTEALKVHAKELEDYFSSNPIVFSLKTDVKGTAFGSVKAGDIEEKLKSLGYEGKIELERPLKILGTTQVLLDLGRGVTANIKISILSSPKD